MAHPWPTQSSGHPYAWKHPVEPAYYSDAPKATGATAGVPGTFTPAGNGKVNNLAEMSGVTASPATAWTTGQRVLLNDGSEATWTGSAWAAGRAAAEDADSQ